MTTLTEARRALLELQDNYNHMQDGQFRTNLAVVSDYLDSLVPLKIENHTPGEKITAETFHALYGSRPRVFAASDEFTVPKDDTTIDRVVVFDPNGEPGNRVTSYTVAPGSAVHCAPSMGPGLGGGAKITTRKQIDGPNGSIITVEW